MEFLDLLRTIVKEDGSDLYFSTGAPPSMKVLGKLTPITDKAYSPNAFTFRMANLHTIVQESFVGFPRDRGRWVLL